MSKISTQLLQWYEKNKRPLPWRENKMAYSIWLSEIILQQTKVEQGLPYYLKFIENYPKVENLAMASEDEVLKLWQGLGYYSRARNLHKTAKIVSNDFGGQFPENYEELLKFPGIGEYTAAAIASIVHGEAVPVLDGNVYRILSRIFGIEAVVGTSMAKKQFLKKAKELMGKKNPGEFNQAMMEFGAMHCKPKLPKCKGCFLAKKCVAFKNNEVQNLPYVKKKKPVLNLYLNYFVFTDGNEIIIQRRNNDGIWKGLYEFPIQEGKSLLNHEDVPFSHNVIETMDFKHMLTHRRLHIRFFVFDCHPLPDLSEGQIKVELRKLGLFAVPKPIESFIEKSQELHLKVF